MKTKRVIRHSLFWLLAASFYSLLIGRGGGSLQISALYIAVLIPVVILITYLINYYLIPRYFLAQQFFTFFYLLVSAFILATYLQIISIVGLLYWMAEANIAHLSRPIRDQVVQGLALLIIPFLFTAIRALRQWIFQRKRTSELEKAKLETELKLREAELNLLKSQVHPHFLFNTLNNLYALSLEHSNKTPEVVLQLSALLDYMLYQGNEPLVPLSKELDHIKNYVSLEQIRFDDPDMIQLSGGPPPDGWQIAPLLLIPLVENCFKHLGTNELGERYIQISWQAKTDFVLALCNTYAPGASRPTGATGGIGKENVAKRLELLYPDRHQLHVKEKEGTYGVTLVIKQNAI